MAWTFTRWVLGLAAVEWSLLYLNQGFFSAWQTVAPMGNRHPEAWAYEAYKAFGYAVGLLVLAVLIFINLRLGWPYLKSRWTALLSLVAILALVLPRAVHFLDVDACLDRGGRWNDLYQVCET